MNRIKAIFVKTLLILTPIALFAGEEVAFKASEAPKIGESNAFKLAKTDRAVLRISEREYIVIELLESIRSDGESTFAEACTVAWTRINPQGIKGGTTKGYIQYKSEKQRENEFAVVAVGGSDQLIMEDYSIQWSYGSESNVFLYPSVGTFFANTEVVEPDTPAKKQATIR